MIVGGAVDSIVLPIDQCIVPAGIVGPVAISILSDPQPVLASQITDQNQNTTVAGPTIIFVDFGTPEQTLAQIILSPGSKLTKDLNGVSSLAASCSSGDCSPATSASTSTISNEHASAVAAAGGAAAATGTTTADASAATAAEIDEGFITPIMPAAASTTAAVGSAGLPLASSGVSAAVSVSDASSASADMIVPAMPTAAASTATPSAGQLNVAAPVQIIGFDN